MILRRHRKFTVQMAEYETFSFGADVELSHIDLGYTDEEVANMSTSDYAAMRDELTAAVLEELHEQLTEEIERTAQDSENRRTFVRRAKRLMAWVHRHQPTATATATATSQQPPARKQVKHAEAHRSTRAPRAD